MLSELDCHTARKCILFVVLLCYVIGEGHHIVPLPLLCCDNLLE